MISKEASGRHLKQLEEVTFPQIDMPDSRYKISYIEIDDVIEETHVPYHEESLLFLNGAEVNCKHGDLKYSINKANDGRILSVDFTMPSDEDWLSEIFDQTPFGLIKKNRTGIGATTLEQKSQRNSIIVVPTRSLASTKAISGNRDGNTCLYVGGAVPHIKDQPSVKSYLSDETIKVKKFIVVADSLPYLINEIGIEQCKDYFLMVDEVDSYQYDSHYRPKLEVVIDYYFNCFPPERRCLVSATVGEFSDDRINNEPLINVCFNKPAPRKISLIRSNNVIETTRKKIESLRKEYPDDKILVAYNAIHQGILPTIKLLEEQYSNECAVMCSVNSKVHVGDLYAEMSNGILPAKITFMTCTYFVGIDINERYHLISVADVSCPYTLLSEDKFLQIAGRCRNKDGLISETIIYHPNDDNSLFLETDRIAKEDILTDAMKLACFAESVPEIQAKFPKVFPQYNSLTQEYIIAHSYRKYGKTEEIPLIRKNAITNEIQPAYFNIDRILIQQELNNTLYGKSLALKNALDKSGHEVTYFDVSEDREIPSSIYTEINKEINESNDQQLDSIIADLRKLETQGERFIYANKVQCSRENKRFLEYFKMLQKYVPFDVLVEKLSPLKTKREYEKFHKATIIWALDAKHPIKCSIKESFPLGAKVTGSEIETGVTAIWNGLLNMGRLKHNQCYIILDLFCVKSNRTTKKIKGKPISCYTIVNYDVNGFGCAPLEYIPADANIHSILEL